MSKIKAYWDRVGPWLKRHWRVVVPIVIVGGAVHWVGVFSPVSLGQWVLYLWDGVSGFGCGVFDLGHGVFVSWCGCRGADCTANPELSCILTVVAVAAVVVLVARWLWGRFEIIRRVIEAWFRPIWQSLTAILLIAAVFLSWYYWADIWRWSLGFWGWSRGGGDEALSNGEMLRNLFLILAVPVGLLLALWRNWSAERESRTSARQAEISNEQISIANEQARTAELNLNNERHEKGVSMLGSATLVTRMDGISTLERLAQEYPEEYHVQIADLLCTFICHPTVHDQQKPSDKTGRKTSDKTGRKKCTPAIEAAAQALGKRSEQQIRIERRDEFRLDMRDANLSGADLSGANFLGASLSGANFSDASLSGADLSGADLPGAGFSGASLQDADLSGASLRDADLSGAFLSGANFLDATLISTDFSGTRLFQANFSNALLSDTNFSGADLGGVDLSGLNFHHADLTGANLSGAKLDGVENLTQAQLDDAFIWEEREPPSLEDAVDSETNEPLVWRGEERPRY